MTNSSAATPSYALPCSPMRSTIMTGQYPYHLGLANGVIIVDHPYGMLLNQTTLANELKKDDYAKHMAGWHVQVGVYATYKYIRTYQDTT